MKNAARLTAAIALVTLAAGAAAATEGVSPGALDRFAQVNSPCPTFSWGIDSEAVEYELVAYILPEDNAQQVELTADREALYTRVAGSATSWTPSADRCFAPGGRYVWFVRAVQQFAGDQVIEATEWSAGRYFQVPAGPTAEELTRAVDTLKRWEAANGGGSPALFAGADAVPAAAADSGTGLGLSHRKGEGEGHRKSVPTASAAIRGEHPSFTGESYGVIGTASSPDGAGVAAAHLDGGPDLVLDGSVDGEADTRIWEWGIDRTSSSDEVFQVNNSGAGVLHLDVEGDIAGSAVRATEVVINGSTVIDGTGAWTGAGDMLPCPGCVSSSDITDGGVASTDLANGAVTSTKIAAGAVGASAMHANAVTTTALADAAVTAAKLAPGAIGSAALGPDSVDSSHIVDGAVATADLADSSVDYHKIALGNVRTGHLQNAAVRTDKIYDGAVTAPKLAPGAVGSTALGPDSVDSSHIVAGAVAASEIADGSVSYRELATGSVRSTHIFDGAVGTTNLADGAVTSLKIGPLAVNEGSLQDWAVTTDKIHPGAVIGSKLALDSVQSGNILDGTVSSSDIRDGTITAADVSPTGGVYASKSAVYVVTETLTVPAWACQVVSPDCNDANDLPLFGFFSADVVDSDYEVTAQTITAWDNLTEPAWYRVEICQNTSSPGELSGSIVCVSVPGS